MAETQKTFNFRDPRYTASVKQLKQQARVAALRELFQNERKTNTYSPETFPDKFFKLRVGKEYEASLYTDALEWYSRTGARDQWEGKNYDTSQLLNKALKYLPEAPPKPIYRGLRVYEPVKFKTNPAVPTFQRLSKQSRNIANLSEGDILVSDLPTSWTRSFKKGIQFTGGGKEIKDINKPMANPEGWNEPGVLFVNKSPRVGKDVSAVLDRLDEAETLVPPQTHVRVTGIREVPTRGGTIKVVNVENLDKLKAAQLKAMGSRVFKNVLRGLPFMQLASLLMQGKSYKDDPQAMLASQLGVQLAPKGTLDRDVQLGQVA